MKQTFVTLEKIQEICKTYPTPFHLYDEAGIRKNVEELKKAFSWNKGFKEYFAVKANPNPFLIQILREYGCGCDCSSLNELKIAHAVGCLGNEIMFSSNDTPAEEYAYVNKLGGRDHAKVKGKNKICKLVGRDWHTLPPGRSPKRYYGNRKPCPGDLRRNIDPAHTI